MSEITYCPEDDKLRLYVGRLSRDEYERLRKAGYSSTPKQDCDFVATWTPSREDIAREFLGPGDDIGDEDFGPEERAADRAERFGDYLDKRRDEAGGHADDFDSGPSAFGHQNRQRAERQAARHDRHRGRALSQWSKAEYWQTRTAGVISHALHKSNPGVRRGRILTIEKEQRKTLKSIAESQRRYDAWKAVAGMDGADVLLPLNSDGYAIFAEMNHAQRAAYALANDGRSLFSAWHPTSESANAKNRDIHTSYPVRFSAYDFLTMTEYIGEPFERFTPKQMADLYLSEVSDPSTTNNRWVDHLAMRLIYGNLMLENEGGKASEVEIEPGGFFGRH